MPDTVNTESDGEKSDAERKSTHLKFLFGAVGFDMLSIGMIVPLISPFSRELGATPQQLGILSSVYGMTQLASSPILGSASDKISRRTILLLSLIGGACGYGFLGCATEIWMVFVSRFLSGIFRQTLTVSKAWIADLSEPDQLSKILSWFYAIISLGFMIGPAIGGFIAESYGYRLPILLSTILFFVNGVVVRSTLPLGKLSTSKKEPKTGSKSFFDELASLRPDVQKLLVLRFFIGLSVVLSRGGIFMLLEYREEWDFNVAHKGLIISYFSVVQVLMQLFGVGPVMAKLSENSAIIAGAAVLAFSQAVCALATNFYVFLLAIAAISVSSAVLKVAMSNALTNAAGLSSRGEVLGMAGSVMSVCRAGSGVISGYLVEKFDASAPGLAAATSMVLVSALSTVLLPKTVAENKDNTTRKKND